MKNAEERLGMANSMYGKVTEHAFFANLNWHEAHQGLLTVPIVPNVVSAPPSLSVSTSIDLLEVKPRHILL